MILTNTLAAEVWWLNRRLNYAQSFAVAERMVQERAARETTGTMYLDEYIKTLVRKGKLTL